MKGQASQIFTYIISGLVIVSVLVFGVKWIFQVMNTADEIECLDFKQNLEHRLKRDMGYGKVDKADLRVGCETSQICFVDPSKTSTPEIEKNEYPVIYDSWEDGADTNIFFVNNIAEGFHHVENLEVEDPYYICKNVTGGSVEFTFEGQGDSVLVKE